MIELLKNIGLAVVAVVLAYYLIPIGILAAVIFLIFKFDKQLTWKYLNRLFFNIAKCIDIMGNYACAVLFNWILIRMNESAYRFGKENETISSALGKNYKANNLTWVGKILVVILDFFDKNHVIKSIQP